MVYSAVRAAPQPLRCLVVEDQLMFRQLLVGMLQIRNQLEVVAAVATAAEAIAACAEYRPDLLILDYQLPDADGLSVARALQVLNPQSRAIVLSSFASTVQRPTELRTMITAIIDKGRAFQDLLQAIHELSPDIASQGIAPSVDLNCLSARELEVLRELGAGHSSRQIAEALSISVRTVETHRRNIASKLGISGSLLIARAAVFLEQSQNIPGLGHEPLHQ